MALVSRRPRIRGPPEALGADERSEFAGLGYIHLLKCVAPLFRMDSAKSDEMVSKLGGGVFYAQRLEDVDWSA